MRILPRHLRDLIDVLDIALDHRNVSGMAPMAANIAFIEVLKAWPLYGATFFDVTVREGPHLSRTTMSASARSKYTVSITTSEVSQQPFSFQQSYADSLPKFIWLAVSQLGIHLMEQRGQVRSSREFT